MALIVALWVLGLLSLVAAAFMADTRTEARLARNLIENAKAEALADAAVHRAIAALLDPDPVRQPRVDGTVYRWFFGGGQSLVSVEDESGKIDLNTAADPLLEGLFVSVGTDPATSKRLVAAVRDFADPDQLVRPDGAEDPEYEAAGLVGGAMDGRFGNVADLQQVLGMTSDLYDRTAPVLTVYSGGRSIDPATAPRGALLALPGANREQVDAVLASRNQATDPTTRTARKAASADGASSGSEGLALLDNLGIAEGNHTVGAIQEARGEGVYTITANASTSNGGIFERQAIVRLTGDPLRPFVFYEWHRAWESTTGRQPTNADR